MRLGAPVLPRCPGAAREEGLAPALTLLGSLVAPGLLPCGPGGHAVVPQEVAASADRVWADGVVVDRSGLDESTVDTIDLPGGAVVLLRVLDTRSGEDGPKMYGNSVLVPRLRAADPETDPGTSDPGAFDQRAAWALGLVWLRLGLSEALRETCMRYLNGRRTGNTTLLQQQMVKSTVADGLIEHLEVRAVLTGVDAGEPPGVILAHLHARITAADRWLVNLLGASGYLVGGPGQVAHLSELLAEAYVPTPTTHAGVAAGSVGGGSADVVGGMAAGLAGGGPVDVVGGTAAGPVGAADAGAAGVAGSGAGGSGAGGAPGANAAGVGAVGAGGVRSVGVES
ncbi:hypothetical protein [Saccharothrix luteola]|uniref:hypothetical protein n=1 Tax=Saccharothrix luteola TaxID=2893018 RepID=UPI001E5481A5|nr:hypothetical protein [Saccharothrix luteola]MCC8246767.1 hypothetical protein [Saccharothrix luteola]